jgi:group I intron endonuclease
MYHVYLIINSKNDKKYVGYTKYDYIYRYRQHISAAKRGSKKILCKAMRKYGFDNFEIRLISTARDLKMAKLWEERLVFALNTFGKGGYNLTKGGDGSGDHTQEHKEYMRILMTGRIISEDTKKKMSISATGKPKSVEFKKAVSEKLKNDPNISKRNRISVSLSHYRRGHKLSPENLILVKEYLTRQA